MLQRQIMFKQLEELQRQKKLQELNDSRQQNVINQQSLLHNKQPPGSQYAPLINGTPVRDPSQMSPMFMFGNTNLIHGFQNVSPYSQPQSLVDGTPGHGFSRFAFQGATISSQVDMTARSSMNDQFSVPSKNMFGPVFSQSPDMGTQTGNDQDQEPQEFTSLDPLEQKFLFNTDDNISGGFGNMFEDTDKNTTQAFPSLQSGSWSALMQSALDETSSTDTGVQEEWSGLSFQNPEMSNDMFQTPPSLEVSAQVPQVQRFSPLQSGHGQEFELLQKVDNFREYKHGNQSCYTELDPSSKIIPKGETSDAFNNSSVPQSFGLRLAPPSQRIPANYLDPSQVTSHLTLLKNQDGNSTRQPNVWVDIPSQQNLSTSDISEASDYGKGQEGKIQSKEESFSGLGAAPHMSPLNPTSAIRALVKNESVVDADHPKFPQVSSMSQLTSAYENYKAMLMSSDQTVKNPSHPHRNSSFVQMNLVNTSQYGSVWPVTGTRDVPNQDSLISKSKKRKSPTFELLPWHKQVSEHSSRRHDTSIADLEWALATNRVPEKMKEETKIKKRIILTTQLMQMLFRPGPAATTCYDSIAYFSARLALGDACSLANNPHSKNVTISKGSGDENLSKIVQDLIHRSKKLEDEVLRLENGGSVLEIRMESQDLERFSVINRFAKFHSRAAAETTTGGSNVPKLYPQRYVTASPMPRVVPEGHNCLSL